MKVLLWTIFLLLCNAKAAAQIYCDITQAYQEIFKIEQKTYENSRYLLKTIREIDSTLCFADMVNQNPQYFNYLSKHFTNNLDNEALKAISDPVELQNTYIHSLENDSLFQSIMQSLAQQISPTPTSDRDTVSMGEILNIAVKYFTIVRIDSNGNYVGRVCTGINGVKQTEKKRRPHLEAFCFTTVLKHYQGEEWNMQKEFINGIKALYSLNLGIDKKERLLRAQGAMYLLMKQNIALRENLEQEYQNNQAYLPFLLIEE